MNEKEAAEAELIIGLGSQGTAGLAIMRQLMGTLIKKKVLHRVEVVATLELAAEAVEKQKAADVTGGSYVQATSAAIRDLSKEFQGEAWNEPTTH